MSDHDSRILLYYRSKEQIKAWSAVPAADKLARLQMQTEFFHKAMSPKARRIRDRLKEGRLFVVDEDKGRIS